MQLPADYIRTCIPLEEGTGKYNFKVRATPAKVRIAKGIKVYKITLVHYTYTLQFTHLLYLQVVLLEFLSSTVFCWRKTSSC